MNFEGQLVGLHIDSTCMCAWSLDFWNTLFRNLVCYDPVKCNNNDVPALLSKNRDIIIIVFS